MVAELQCLAIEKVDIPEDKNGKKIAPFTSVTFLDNDFENRLAAFLKYRLEPGDSFKPGQIYKFAVTGLGPVKEDRSSYYLRGRVVDGK